MKDVFLRTETVQIDLKKEFPGLLWDMVIFEEAKIVNNRYLKVDITFVMEIENDRSKRNRNKQNRRT